MDPVSAALPKNLRRIFIATLPDTNTRQAQMFDNTEERQILQKEANKTLLEAFLHISISKYCPPYTFGLIFNEKAT